MKQVKLRINDVEVTVGSNLTVMEAADQAGIVIPRLCHHRALKPSGSCRLCAVEIDGHRGLPAACSTPVEDGMTVRTATAKIQDFRRETLRLILKDHPRECLGCPRNGSCELQQLVQAVGIDYPYPVPTDERPDVKPGGGYFERDYSLCVRCGRCVRVCHEVRGARAIVLREAGGRQEVGTPFDRPLEEVGCQFCGACVDVCPVGALRDRLSPERARPQEEMQELCAHMAHLVLDLLRSERPHRWTAALCPICTANCRLMFDLGEDGRILQVKPHPMGASNNGQACVQGRYLLRGYVERPDRLAQPLIRDGDSYREASWDEALDRVAEALRGCGPGETAMVSDGRATNEELYLLQKFARTGLRTNAVGCLAPPAAQRVAQVLRENLGCVAATNSFADLAEAGSILALGVNPAASQPIAGVRIREAVLRGAKLIVAGPYDVPISHYAHIHLRHYPGTETALLAGLMRVLVDEKQVDPGFAEKYPEAFEALRTALAGYDLGTVAAVTGVAEDQIVEAACLMGGAATTSLVFGLGLLESPAASEALRALITLAHMRGSFGLPGGGLVPLYGSGNFQGAWDMGLASDLLPGQVDWASDELRGCFAHAWETELAAEPVPDLAAALTGGKIKALVLARETTDGAADAGGLQTLKPYLDQPGFTVLLDTVAPADGIEADVVLPMAAMLEKEGTLTSGERRVQWTRPILAAPPEARTLQWVLAQLAARLGLAGFDHQGPGAVWEEIRKMIPSHAGITPERILAGTVQWPCPEAEHPGSPMLFTDSKPAWAGWRPQPPVVPELEPDQEYPFAVMEKDRIQTSFLGPLLAPEAAAQVATDGDIEMNPADAFSMGLTPGDTIAVVTSAGEWTGRLAMSRFLGPKAVAVGASLARDMAGDSSVIGKISAARIEKR